MAYSEFLADRIRVVLRDNSVSFIEKKMMGGLTFMVDDKMCVGIIKDEFMARIDPEIQESVLKKPWARRMDFTGKPMKGFLIISPEGIDMDEQLEYWIKLALDYNPKAKSSKRK